MSKHFVDMIEAGKLAVEDGHVIVINIVKHDGSVMDAIDPTQACNRIVIGLDEEGKPTVRGTYGVKNQ